MVPEAGQRLGPYEILAQLGSGGMGMVFRAWDARLLREVAIKLLHEDYKTPGVRERFLQEARAASALNHPNICTIYDIGEQDGVPYMVMELLEGRTLKQRLSEGVPTAEEIVHVAEQMAEALAAAHARGIVHRDIKPANVMLLKRPDGGTRVKVLDFGLAKVTRGDEAEGSRWVGRASMEWAPRTLDMSAGGSTVGTLAYMSPEQARGEALDARSDLFSLGVVMYEMATRRVPFRGATSAMVYVQLLSRAPEPIRDWNDTVPRELERVILRLLAKPREERYERAEEVGEALRRLSARRGGMWLRTMPKPTVPLVPSTDPVARQGRPVRAAVLVTEGGWGRASSVEADLPVVDGGGGRDSGVLGGLLRRVTVRLTGVSGGCEHE